MNLNRPPRTEGEMSRRKLLTGLSVVGAMAAVGAASELTRREQKAPEGERGRPDAFLDFERHPKIYPMGKLANLKVGHPLDKYFGLSMGHPLERWANPKRVGATEPIDFKGQLAHMWKIKNKLGGYAPEFLRASRRKVLSYTPEGARHWSLADLDRFFARSIESCRKALPIDSVARRYKLNAGQADLFAKMAGMISSRHLFAYAMTELLPGKDGAFNLAIMEQTLKSAGFEFISAIPAMGDPYLSSGVFQFTSFALKDAGKEVHGASQLNRLAKAHSGHPLVADSVEALSDDDQGKAAYLFALYNLAQGIRLLDGAAVAHALRMAHEPEFSRDTAEFIATAHNRPAGAYKALEAHIKAHRAYSAASARKKGRVEKRQEPLRRPDLVSSMSSRIKAYGEKTRANFLALA